MKQADILKNHTRKELNELAGDMGIPDPNDFPNKSALADEIISVVEDKDRKDGVYQQIETIKSVLKDARTTPLDIDYFKEDFKKLMSAKKDSDLETMLDLLRDLKGEGELITRLNVELEGLEKVIAGLDDEEKEVFKEQLDGIFDGREPRDLERYIRECKDLKKIMEEQMDSTKKTQRDERKVDKNTLKIKNIYKKIVAIEKALQHVKKDLEALNDD